MQRVFQYTSILLFLCMMGCRTSIIYHPEVQQGNIMTAEHIDKVHRGMTMEQVQTILGSPILTNTFSRDRFNSVYTYQSVKKNVPETKVVIYFDKGRVSTIEKDGPVN